MNEQANTQLVRQAYQAVKAGDIQSFMGLLSADVVWQMPEIDNVRFAGTWKGLQAVGKFFGLVAETQDVVEFEPEEFLAQADKVVVLGHFAMHVKASGKTSRSEWAHVWTVEGGRVRHMREYVDTLAVSRAHTPG